jgi:crotonobetainyl-CoA:carnitine CoA-transferase CaiB-like acyl-CoA transferase
MTIEGPLSHLRAIDFSTGIPGGYCTKLLADAGVDVIKVEPPGGDPLRGWPCWWYFRVDGITPDETITLRLRGSTATVSISPRTSNDCLR